MGVRCTYKVISPSFERNDTIAISLSTHVLYVVCHDIIILQRNQRESWMHVYITMHLIASYIILDVPVYVGYRIIFPFSYFINFIYYIRNYV